MLQRSLEDRWSTHSQTEVIILCPSLRLADYDVVVTTYSLVSKEIPVQKDEAERPSKDADHVVSNMFCVFMIKQQFWLLSFISFSAVRCEYRHGYTEGVGSWYLILFAPFWHQ